MSKTRKIIIPGVKVDEMDYLNKIYEIRPAVFLIMFLTAWRAQITSCLSSFIQNKEEIQGLNSQRTIASLFLTDNPLVKRFFAGIAVMRTLYLNSEDLAQLNETEAKAYIGGVIDRLAETSGRAQIQPSKLVHPQLVDVHRRGIMAQIRGLIQAKGIHFPGELMLNLNPQLVTLKDVVAIWESMCLVIGGPFNLQDIVGPCEDPYKQFLIKQLFSGTNNPFIFADNIKISVNPENLTPLEEGLPIERTLPIDPPEMEAPGEDANPFLKLAFNQLQELELVKVKTSEPKVKDGSAAPKRVKSKKSSKTNASNQNKQGNKPSRKSK